VLNSKPTALLASARREALVAIAAWLVALLYSVGYCYRHGYERSPENLSFVCGIPDWTFWGIVVPWVSCFLFSVWFALGYMRDAPLSDEDNSPKEDDGG
jgi:hypothetical protein